MCIEWRCACGFGIILWLFFLMFSEISDNILRTQKYMIGLDSYSRQVFIYLDPILIYISLWIDCLFEIRKIAVCFLLLSLPGDYRVTDEALLAETTLYDPSSFLWTFSLLLKDLISDFIFDFTAAGVVPCGGRKTSPRTSAIVQFIFYFGPLRSAIIFWEIRNKWLV